MKSPFRIVKFVVLTSQSSLFAFASQIDNDCCLTMLLVLYLPYGMMFVFQFLLCASEVTYWYGKRTLMMIFELFSRTFSLEGRGNLCKHIYIIFWTDRYNDVITFESNLRQKTKKTKNSNFRTTTIKTNKQTYIHTYR